jgi:hypothetical protein
MVMLAFEAINQCRVVLTVGLDPEGPEAVLNWTAEAWERERSSTEAKPLASVRWKIGSTDVRTMDALILQLMYKLDGAMAKEEFSRVLNK